MHFWNETIVTPQNMFGPYIQGHGGLKYVVHYLIIEMTSNHKMEKCN